MGRKKKGATEQGVPEEGEQLSLPEQGTQEQEIVVKMESMLDDEHDRLLDEVTESIRQGNQEEDEERAELLADEEPEPEPEPKTKEPVAEQEPEEGVAEATEDEEVEVKVEGKVERKKTSDIRKELAEYQKHGAADKRLEEATKLLKKAEEMLQKNQALPEAKSKDELNKIRKDYLNALQYGTGSDEDIAAMERYEKTFLRSGGGQPTIDQNEIVQTVRNATRETLSVVERERQFEEANKDVVSDPFWKEFVFEKTRAHIQSNGGDPFEIATQIVNQIRQKVGAKQQEEPSDELQAKRERKMANPSIPQASGRIPSEPEPETRPLTMAEQIAEMNRDREGLPIKQALRGKY